MFLVVVCDSQISSNIPTDMQILICVHSSTEIDVLQLAMITQMNLQSITEEDPAYKQKRVLVADQGPGLKEFKNHLLEAAKTTRGVKTPEGKPLGKRADHAQLFLINAGGVRGPGTHKRQSLEVSCLWSTATEA